MKCTCCQQNEATTVENLCKVCQKVRDRGRSKCRPVGKAGK